MDKELAEIKRDLKSALDALTVVLDRAERFVRRTGQKWEFPVLWEFLRRNVERAQLSLSGDFKEGPFRMTRNNKIVMSEESP